MLARTDSSGDTLSVRHILGVDANGGFLCGVADGGYAVLAESGGRIFVRRFSPAGDSLWNYQSTWGGPVSSFIPTYDGGCLVVGRIPDTAFDMGAIKLARDGHEEWARWYDEPRMFDSWARGAASTHDLGYILCGTANDYVSKYLRLARLRPNGDSVWTRTYHGPVAPMLSAVTETQDRGFLAAGSEFDTLQSLDALYLLRTDSVGAPLWTRHIVVPGAATRAAALQPTNDGGYLIAGAIDWGDSARAWLVKTDANADTIWTRVLPGTGRELAADVQRTMDGGYVIAGTSDSASGSVLLVKTDSLGRILPTGMAEGQPVLRGDAALSASPNPFRSSVLIRFSPQLQTATCKLVTVFDAQGRLCRQLRISNPKSVIALDFRGQRAGVYLIRVRTADHTATARVVFTP